MGEYAFHGQDQVKIGTCEDMYYLRADQLDAVHGGDAGNLKSSLGVVRFRFPFPDEDGVSPGSFEDYRRGFNVPGYSLPAKLSGDEHGSLQFSHRAGYLVSLPCPEQFGQPGMSVKMPDGLTVHRNGFSGGPKIVQQAYRGGLLVTLLHCGSCGAKHRLDTLDDARPVIEALRAEAATKDYRGGEWVERHPVGSTGREMLDGIAQRIEDGYAVTVPV